MADNTKKMPLYDDETRPYEVGRYVPIKRMAGNALVRGICHDCGLEREEWICILAEDKTIANATIQGLESILACKRDGCGGPLQLSIELKQR